MPWDAKGRGWGPEATTTFPKVPLALDRHIVWPRWEIRLHRSSQWHLDAWNIFVGRGWTTAACRETAGVRVLCCASCGRRKKGEVVVVQELWSERLPPTTASSGIPRHQTTPPHSSNQFSIVAQPSVPLRRSSGSQSDRLRWASPLPQRQLARRSWLPGTWPLCQLLTLRPVAQHL